MSTLSEDSTPFALLLDDNLLSSARVAPQLKTMGYRVQTSRRVPESLENAPQLILINLGSRPLNGVEKIGECRAQFPEAKIIGFCGHLEIEIRREAKAQGIDKLLTNEQAMSELRSALGS